MNHLERTPESYKLLLPMSQNGWTVEMTWRAIDYHFVTLMPIHCKLRDLIFFLYRPRLMRDLF